MQTSSSLSISTIARGQAVFLMTYGMHYCGIFQGSVDGAVMLSDVRIIGAVGPMVCFTLGEARNGTNEHSSEPIYSDPKTVGNVPLAGVQFFGVMAQLPVRA